jgi:hypothetical protein
LFSEATDSFLNDIDLSSTRVVALPQIILVLGGPTSIQPADSHKSNRNIFVAKMLENNDPLALLLKMPEQYPEWNQFDGYPDLVEFEKDAGSLSKAILLFSESAGAVAELANFANDPILCDRLIAVFSKKHFEQASYIKFGPIKQIQRHSDHSICVIHANSPSEFVNEIGDVSQTLKTKFDLDPKTTKFDLSQRRDRLLLLADLVDLFSALGITDFINILKKLDTDSDRKTIERELNLLEMFGLLVSSTSDRKFYVAPKGRLRNSFLNYKAKTGSASFDRARQKTRFFELIKLDRSRQKAYQLIHGSVAA